MTTKNVTIEYLHAVLAGRGVKFATDRLSDVSRQIRNFNRRERDGILRDMGLKKVRGALGGTYWE